MPLRSVQGKKGFLRSIVLIAAAFLYDAPSFANVFAINDDGAVALVADVNALPPTTLVEDRDPSPSLSLVAAATPLRAIPVPAAFARATAKAASENGLAPDLLAAVVWQESRWRPGAVSSAGAVGLAQLMPSTAKGMRVDPRDPTANLYGAAHYLRSQLDRFGGNVELALAAYNAGPVRVRKAGGVPAIAETRSYVTAIMGRLSAIPNEEE